MSIIKSIKQVLGIHNAASENHFWDGSVANQLSLKRGTPDAPGAELIKALNGVLSFPNQGQSLAGSNGYVKLPGGLILQWGIAKGASSPEAVAFPIPFPTACLSVQATMDSISSADQCTVQAYTVSGFNMCKTGTNWANWIAIGY